MLSERLTLVRNDVDERFPHDGWKGELRGEFSIEIFLHDPRALTRQSDASAPSLCECNIRATKRK